MLLLAISVQLSKSLLLPHFTYCCEIFTFGLDEECKRVLNKAFNACVRYVFGLRRRDELDGYKNLILGCSLLDYLKYRSMLFLYKVINTGSPSYIFEKFRFGQSARTGMVIPQRTTVSRTFNSLLFNGIHVYNSLPIYIRRSPTISHFKRSYIDYCCRGS